MRRPLHPPCALVLATLLAGVTACGRAEAPASGDSDLAGDGDLLPGDGDDDDDGDDDALLPGESCANAEALGAGTHTGQSTAGYANDLEGGFEPWGTCMLPGLGRDRVYRIAVGPSQRLEVTVAPEDDGFDPALVLVAPMSCAADLDACLDADDTGDAAAQNRVAYTNRADASVDVLLVVDTYDDTHPGGAFTLTVSLAAPPPGDVCESAPTLGAGSYLETVVGFTNDYAGASGGNGCTASDLGPERVYAVDVPPGQELTASVTPPEGSAFNPSIYLVAAPAAACDAAPRRCLAADDEGWPNHTNEVSWSNYDEEAARVFVIIDTLQLGGDGDTYSLQLSLSAAPTLLPGDQCHNAVAIVEGTLAAETTVGYGSDLTPPMSCTGASAAGADRVYDIDVPAGQTLTVTLTPEGSYDPGLYLLAAVEGCAGTLACLAGADDGVHLDAETVTWTNAGAAAATVLVVVDGYDAAGGVFALSVSVE